MIRQKSLIFVAFVMAGLLGTTDASSALEAGQKAPDFKLPATTGLDISLNDFKGKKWIFLEFYGGAFVPT